jgi:quercetin dioxygenase-like cupin family protein
MPRGRGPPVAGVTVTPRARHRPFAVIAAFVACCAMPTMNGSDAALATPARDFASDVTASFFQRISIVGATDADGSHPRIRLGAELPARVFIVTNTIAPGGHSGWHTHPGPSVVLVKAGTATVYDGHDPNCTAVRYPAGTGFIDAGGTHVHLIRNEGTEQLVTVAFQIVPAADGRRIDAPVPAPCRESGASRGTSE